MTSTVRNLWRWRRLVWRLSFSKLRSIHSRTMLGYLWWILDPIIMMGVYTLVIGFIRGGTRIHEPYPAFALCGLVAWKSFAAPILDSIDSMSRNAGLVKSYSFPRAVIPLSIVLSAQLLFLFSLLPLVLVCLFYEYAMGNADISVGAALAYVPLVMSVQTLLSLGASLALSGLGAFYRDLKNISRHFLRAMWFLSPGLYAISDVLRGYRGMAFVDWSRLSCVYVMNPVAHVIESYRAVILYGRPPDWTGLLFSFLAGLMLTMVSLVFFQARESFFARVV